MGFENKQPVPVEPFHYPGDEPDEAPPKVSATLVVRLLEMIVSADSPQGVWRRAEVAAHMLRVPGAAETQRELAKRLGVSEPAASKAVKLCRQKMAVLLKD